MKKLPIGISDFKVIINDYYYVDKTLLVKELVDSSGLVLLIPRPRRFGKTLNLSMLKYFFEKTEIDNSYLFKNTEIWKHQGYRKLQGKFPVIFLTFKDIKEVSWEIAYNKIISLIAQEFKHHFAVLEKFLAKNDLCDYIKILEKTANEELYHTSLFFLSRVLREVYNEQVIILIDEYDAIIHSGYNNHYYDKATQFMRSILTPVLKDNKYLERGILTGILRTAKEGVFSGLNNLKICSLLDSSFQDKFGFTQSEIKQFLKDYNLLDNVSDVQKWYNGYMFSDTLIYNPWSLLMYVDQQGKLQPYWVNTSDNQIIKKLLILSDASLKTDLELLLLGNTVTKIVNEAIVFPGIESNSEAVWSLFLFAGYLTYTNYSLDRGRIYCDLKIPNEEVKFLYEDFIQDVFYRTLKTAKSDLFLASLTSGDILTFSALLQEFILNSMSIYDLPSDEPEKSYHLFILGLLVFLIDSYQVKSNRESGYGRYDIMLIPYDKKNLGIVIEFKKVILDRKETLEIAAERALEQINNKHYVQELKSLGIKHIKLLGIAFQGKQILVKSQDIV